MEPDEDEMLAAVAQLLLAASGGLWMLGDAEDKDVV